MADWYAELSAWKQGKLGELGAIATNADDLNQCISTILLTPRGSLALDPEFASDLFDHVDKPLPVARPLVIRDTVEAIQKWEPRVDVKSVEVSIQEASLASLLVIVEWNVKVSDFTGVTEVILR